MIGFIIGLGLLTFVLWIGFKLTGALFSACVWLFIKVPIGLCMMVVGILLCITILLIPIGKWFLGSARALICS